MRFTFESLEDGYNRKWANLQIRPEDDAAARATAKRLLNGKNIYQQIEANTGVPWYFIGLCHYRESDFDFNTYLGNGQSLSRPTTQVPAGRGPFFGANAFAEGAVDALTIQHLVGATDWSIARILYRLEGYNGFGYNNFGVNSPYLYGGSTLYGPPQAKGGKYIRDGVFSTSAIDTQLGTAVILRALIGLDQSINFAAPPAVATTQPDDKQASDVLAVQRALNALLVVPRLAEDGILGPKTMAAVAQFQQQNGLAPAGGLLDATTIAAITKKAAPVPQPALQVGSQPPTQPPSQPVTPTDLAQILQRVEDLLTQIRSGNSNIQSADPITLLQKITSIVPLNTGQKPAQAPVAPTSNDQLQQVINVLNVILGQGGLGQVNGALGQTIGNLLNGKKAAIGIGGSLLTSLLASIPTDPTALSQASSFAKALAPVASLLPPNVALPIFLAIGAWGVLGKLEKWAQRTAPLPKPQSAP